MQTSKPIRKIIRHDGGNYRVRFDEVLWRRSCGIERVAVVRKGEIHAVIGPNGAGKSTLVNLLSGELSPTHGQVFLSGKDLTGLSAADMSLSGVGRTYQK